MSVMNVKSTNQKNVCQLRCQSFLFIKVGSHNCRLARRAGFATGSDLPQPCAYQDASMEALESY